MSGASMRFSVCTPHELVLQLDCRSVRLPTETGQAGLRPRMEATIISVEAGAVLVHTDSGTRFVGTAGGLLSCDGDTGELFTPLAVVGGDGEEVLRELDRALSTPDVELETRAALGRLESTIVSEVRDEDRARSTLWTEERE